MHAAELISTGTELLNGKTINAHACTLARALKMIGVPLMRDTTVPDDPEAIRSAVMDAARRVDLVFISGGLGPTCDDLTREVMQSLLGGELIYDNVALERLRVFCEREEHSFSEERKRQTLVLSQAEVLANSAGAAPGEMIWRDGVCYILLPGPPAEFAHVLETQVLSRLKHYCCDSNHPVYERIFQVDMGEADIVEELAREQFSWAEIDVAYCLSEQGVELRLSGADETQIEAAANAVREALGKHIFTEGRKTLEAVIGELLVGRKATLATAESCTGGLLGDCITGVPGSSAYYLGGIVAYDNSIKTGLLGVERDLLKQYGAVSAEVAGRMAEKVRERFSSTYGIGITGIAGPDGGSEQKPVGLVYVAVASAAEVRIQRYVFNRERRRVKMNAAHKALDLLRSMLDAVSAG